MKTSLAFLSAMALSAQAFAPSSIQPRSVISGTTTSLSMAKYNTMDEILAKFPEDKPVLINFYDAATEADIKSDIVRAKNLLAERCVVVSIKQQDYPGKRRRL
jgi:predicted glycosyltransferase